LAGPVTTRTRPHPAAWAVLIAVVWVAVVLLATSNRSGTGAAQVGDDGAAQLATGTTTGCVPTRSNPGGKNNYRPRAPLDADLGHGFTITGVVRGPDCAPLPGVRVQVWGQTAREGEPQHRTSVLTGSDGVYRVDSDPLVAQFGEPNVHVAHDDPGGPWETVFVRNVLDDDDTRAVVDLVLSPAR